MEMNQSKILPRWLKVKIAGQALIHFLFTHTNIEFFSILHPPIKIKHKHKFVCEIFLYPNRSSENPKLFFFPSWQWMICEILYVRKHFFK